MACLTSIGTDLLASAISVRFALLNLITYHKKFFLPYVDHSISRFLSLHL